MALYYESHVTIDPVFGQDLSNFVAICANYKFRVAKLLMEKGPNTKDAFCTSRSQSYTDIVTRTIELVQRLQREKFVVRRYKIEDTIVDSNIGDKYELFT